MKKAVITGITGQDGSYLAELLLEKGYEVYGVYRRSSIDTFERINHIKDKIKLVCADLLDISLIADVLHKVNPDEVYNLAAQSFVPASWDQPIVTGNINALGATRLLEAIRRANKKIKFYQASSVTFDTPVLIRLPNGKIKRTTFGNTFNVKGFDVLSFDNDTKKVKFLPVKKVLNHGIKDVYKISGRTGLDIKLTADHSIMVLDEKGNIVPKKVSQLQKGDYLITFVGEILERKDPEIWLEYSESHNIPSRWGYGNKTRKTDISIYLDFFKNLMRIAGYYLAEGSSGKYNRNYQVSFCFGSHEPEKVEDLKEVMLKIFNIKPPWIQKRKSSNTIQYVSKAAFTFFSLFGHTAKTKRLPDFVWTLPKEHIHEFLKGYSGDAAFKKKGQVRYTTVNQQLQIDINYLMKLNDLSTYLIERRNLAHPSPQGTIIAESTCYDLELPVESNFMIQRHNVLWKTPSARCLPSHIFKKEKNYWKFKYKKLVSKTKLKEHCIQTPLVNSDLGVIQIREIEYVGREPVGDYVVPGSETFFCGNQPILAHNSSEMFGKVQETPQTEKTPFYPRSPYGVSKVYAYWITKNYRESYDMFACNGILFNHESPRRGKQFVTRKITHSVAKIKLGLQDCFELGNLDAKRDWGYAGDYVKAMYMILNHSKPDDFVIATGDAHSVREFADEAFKNVGIDIKWEGKGLKEVGKFNGKIVVKVNPKFYRPAEVYHLIGDSSKAKKILKWEPKIRFKELVKIMVEHDLKSLQKDI